MSNFDNINCDLCGSDDATYLFEASDLLYGFEGVFTYVRCNKCDLVYMNPQPSAEKLTTYYPDEYAPHNPKQKKTAKLSFLKKIKQFKKDLMSNVKVLPFVKKKIDKDTQLLDIGCGSGKFLARIKEDTGCKAEGVDISGQAAASAKANYDINVFQGNITEAHFADNSFDIITSWWYLEHVTNPSEVLQAMYRLLKDDGNCIVAVPNIDSFSGRVFKQKWYHLDCPRHLYLYSPKTITVLLNKAGFFVEKIVFDKTAWGLFHSCRYQFGKDIPLRNRSHFRGSSFVKSVMMPFTLMLALFKQSDIMVVYASKKP